MQFRNFLIQEEQNGNVVSTSHWIRPVSELQHEIHFNIGDSKMPLLVIMYMIF